MKPGLRFDVFRRDAFTCVYCGRRAPAVILEVDHVLPLVQGGLDGLDNLVTTCVDCNRGKAARALTPDAPGLRAQEKAERIEEHEAQIAAYARWLAAQRAREDDELQQLAAAFERLPHAHFMHRRVRSWFWQPAQVRLFLRQLGYHDVLDALDICAALYRPLRPRDRRDAALGTWKYFCGVCWRKLKPPPGSAR